MRREGERDGPLIFSSRKRAGSMQILFNQAAPLAKIMIPLDSRVILVILSVF
jgi:hypothetical protein